MKTIKYIAAVVMAAFTMNVSAQSFIVYGTDGSKTEFQTENVSRIEFVEGTTDPYNGHEYVDLGLPSGLLWATMNIGATSREDNGAFFAWGETSSKETYDISNYKYGMVTTIPAHVDEDGFDVPEEVIYSYTKYVPKAVASPYGYNGFYDDKTILDLEDDAAHVNWSGSWRMPTVDEIRELKNECTWAFLTLNGKEGYKVTGPNGNYIFLPATVNYPDYTFYLTSTLQYDSFYESRKTIGAYGVAFSTAGYNPYVEHFSRYGGYSVRPVCPKP